MRFLPFLIVMLLWACGRESPSPGSDGAEPTQEPTVAESGAPADISTNSSTSTSVGGEDHPVVVFLGTSLTAGLGLAGRDETYVSRAAALADSAQLPFRVVHAGVSGETSAGGLRRLDWILREPVDVLVLELGANDGLRGLDPDAMAANLDSIIRRTRSRYPAAAVVIAGMEAPTNLGAAYTERFRSVFPRLAREHDACLVPFLLEGVAAVPELNQDDGIHPTPEGHRRMARTLWPCLEQALRAR